METGQFYCVGCQELKDAASGHRVFRTGYFRLVYPLGCCLTCADGDAARSAAAADCPGKVFEAPDVKPRPSSALMPPDLEPSAIRPVLV